MGINFFFFTKCIKANGNNYDGLDKNENEMNFEFPHFNASRVSA